MTDSPTSQAMSPATKDALHAMALAKSRLKELTDRVQELEKALTRICTHFPTDSDMDAAGWDIAGINAACDAYDHARSVLNKETNRG